MTIQAGTIVGIQTTGNDFNGGGYNPNRAGAGTDYSGNDGPTASGSLLTVDAVTNTVVRDSGYSFQAADVGNLMQLQPATGWSTANPFYEIVSVSSGAATLDRSPGAVNLTGGIWRLGGAFATPGMLSKVSAGGLVAWLKNGAYSITTSTQGPGGPIALATGATLLLPAVVRGYGSVRGDSGPFPTITSIVSAITMLNIGSTPLAIVRDLTLDGGGLASTVGINLSSNARAFNIIARNLASGISSAGSNNGIIDRCYALNCSGTGLFCTGEIVNSVAALCGTGILLGGNSRVVRSIAYRNTGRGFNSSVQYTAYQCVAYNNGSDGFNNQVNNVAAFHRCVAYGNAGYGFVNQSNTGSLLVYPDQCAGGNNTSGNYPSAVASNAAELGFVNLSADPFVDGVNGNFMLNNLASGGRLLRNILLALPGLPNSKIYADLGATQRLENPAGSIYLS